MIPRDLNIPFPWGSSGGRIKPYHESYREQETRPGHEDDAIWDTPEFVPILCHQGVYEAAAQLMGRPDLRVQDGSIGITLRNDDSSLVTGGRKEGQVGDPSTAMSQPLHLDPSIPASEDNFTFSPRENQVGAIFYLTDVEPNGGGLHALPGDHRRVRAACAADPRGRHLHNDWLNITGWGDTVEVTARLATSSSRTTCSRTVPRTTGAPVLASLISPAFHAPTTRFTRRPYPR